jgi:bifunctional non-homologous end joining protein LigD
MLARSGPVPVGRGWIYELKFDGFRGIVRTGDDFRVVSRRGWDMSALLPELDGLPAGCVFDGELVAFQDGKPHFPAVCERLLHGNSAVALTYVVFDLLVLEGEPTLKLPYRERRSLLDRLNLGRGPWYVPDAFDDGEALFAAVCEHGLEGVLAKRVTQSYRPGLRGWVKTKNTGYWRYPLELESLRRSIESACSRDPFALRARTVGASSPG